MTSEKVLLRVPHQRIVCCHSSGSLTFGPDGNLYISTGDDTEHAASQGFAPLDDRLRNNPGDNPDADHAYDSRRTSGNTNDLRGKILRIHPEPDGTYTIPAGNLFASPFPSDPTADQARDLHDGSPQPVPDPGRLRRPAGSTTARSARTRTARTPTAARAATTSSTRSARRATWAGRTASPTTRRTATGLPDPRQRGFFDCANGPTQRRPTTTTRPGTPAGAPPPRRAAVVAVRAARERPELPVEHAAAGDPGGSRPHGDRRPDLPLQRGEPERDQVPGLVRRQGVLRRLVARLDRDARAERRRAAEGDHGVHAERRLPAPAGHRDGRRRLPLRPRVGARLQLRRLRHQPRLRPLPDRLREGHPHAGGPRDGRQGLRSRAADRELLERGLRGRRRRRPDVLVGLRRRRDLDRGQPDAHVQRRPARTTSA